MTHAQTDTLPIIPRPRELDRKPDSFVITAETVIIADPPNQSNAAYLQGLITPATGFPLPIRTQTPDSTNVINLKISTAGATSDREGYVLEITPDGLRIEAPDSAGVFYAIQTLRQLLPVSIENRTLVTNAAWQVPCLIVKDAPRFPWRGYMLDEGRHFLGKETVLRALDLMALQKLNVFHWHLTEDQGWRIEIEKYPRLSEIGSMRKGTAYGITNMLRDKHDGVAHGGFYTQNEIQEIVAYATERHITIVPEIEMPGHSKAALAAYPELSCTGGPFEVATRFGFIRDVLCAGKESVFAFLEEVLDEVMALFPSPFIHIGGDEVLKARWKKCPDCQRRIAQQGLKDEGALQDYFTNRITTYLAAHGRRLVGWNEILHDDLHEGAVVQYWLRDRRRVIEALHHGRDVVVSAYRFLYLDHSYSLTPLSAAYAFEPQFPSLDGDAAEHILGLEATMWTEYVPNQARLDYQTYPRLTAFAETGWTPKTAKDFRNFRTRLNVFQGRLEALGVGYARGTDVEPSLLRRLFGPLTIAQAQTKTATKGS